MGKHPVQKAIEALDDDFNYFSGGPPGEAAVAALEAQVGRRLPDAHRALVHLWGAAAVVVKDEVWPAPVAYEIRPRWQMIRGLEIFGTGPAGHPLTLVDRHAELSAMRDGETDLVPLARVIGVARLLCVDEDGDLQWWEDEGGEFVDGFDEAVLEFLEQLATDKRRVQAEGIKRS